MRSIARWVFFVFWASGLFWLIFRLRAQSQKVFCFHSVMPDGLEREETITGGLSISQSDFKNILESIRRRVKITTELGAPNTAVLTFDDGLRNNFDCAMNILTPLGICGYFFVPLSSIADGDLTWYDKVFVWCDYISPGTHVFPSARRKGGDFSVEISDRSSRWRACSEMVRGVESAEIDKSALIKAIDRQKPLLREAMGENYCDRRASVLLAPERERMRRAGHLIGAHSVSHDKLSLLDDDRLRAEFQSCFAEVGREYNTDVFCYPVGSVEAVDLRVVERCARSGFAAGFMNIASLPKAYRRAPKFALPRLNIPPKAKPWEVDAYLTGVDGLFREFARMLGLMKAR